MLLRKRFVPEYLFSFVVGFIFGWLLDLHECWIQILPHGFPWNAAYFLISYFLICTGIIGIWMDKRFRFVTSVKKVLRGIHN
ncbi:MAG: DUF6198 family protein [Ruminococcus sp.]